MRKCYVELRRREISYKQENGWIPGLIISCEGTVFQSVKKGKIEKRMEVTEGRGRRRKQLLDDLTVKKGYWKLKEALDRTLWRTRFRIGYESVVRQQNE
jgi:hypothetical protein